MDVLYFYLEIEHRRQDKTRQDKTRQGKYEQPQASIAMVKSHNAVGLLNSS